MKLTTLSEQRGKAYANADARVCLERTFEKYVGYIFSPLFSSPHSDDD